ncbi:MAG: MATE family efflux transporter, partial [Sphaerochaeta sp.]|uniref:MATE family efflux transporter n=1 Tax=Sphaerochaeta sp. TaxID=1972642 RepID=UPI003D0F6CBA
MNKTEANRTKLTEGPIGRTLFRLALPMVFGILSMVVFNLADTFFVGRLGKEQLAALSFTFPVVLFIGSIAQGIGMGTSAVVSTAIGEKNYRKVHRLVFDSLLLGIILLGIGAILGMFTIRPLFR